MVASPDGTGHPLAILFTSGGLDTDVVRGGEEAIRHVHRVPTDLVVIAAESPDVDGPTVCAELRDGGYEGGIVILAAHHDELAVVTALDLGADDYVSRPWPLAELLSRVRAVLRRLDRLEGRDTADQLSGLHLDVDGHTIRWREVVVTTSGREHELLALLLANRGAVVTREHLMDAIWGSEWSGSPMVLSSAVGRVRERLAAAGASDVIENVRGVGFRLSGSRREDSPGVSGPRGSQSRLSESN